MKFKVRIGFVVHHTTTKKVAGELQETTSTYSEGEEVNFTEAEAKLHAHKLEAADASAKKFLDGLVLSEAQQATSAPAPAADVSEIVAQTVAATLKALGVTGPVGEKK